MLDFIKKISVIYLSIAMVFIVTQGCAEIKQGATRKFNDFTSWLDEMDQKIQRNIKKTGSVNTGNKDGFTISSYTATPNIVKRGDSVEVSLIYQLYKNDNTPTKFKYTVNIIYYNKLSHKILEEELEQDNGQWEDTFIFKVPEAFDYGKYEIRQKIVYENGELQAAAFFTVIR